MSISSQDFADIVITHMEAQPYKITCSECGTALSHDTSVDGELDLHMEVDPCECILRDDGTP